MEDPSLIALFVRPLNEQGISYLVTGGVASIVYGEPRFTRDIDLVVALRPDDAPKIASAFSSEQFYVPPLEVLQTESARDEHGHFNISHHETGLRADCYVAGTDALHAWAFERPHVEHVASDAVRLAPIEYVILRKLSYFQQGRSDRHLADVANMVRIRGDLIDRQALEVWLARLGLEVEWRQALAMEDRP